MAADPQLDQSAEKQARVESSPQHRYSVLQLLGLLTFPLILVVATAYVLFGQGAPTLIDMLREAQAGIAINSTLDLINAVDTQLLLPAETDSVESQLAVFASLAEMLAEEAPELEAALSAWIDTGRELTAARAALAEACTAAESQACEAARQEVAALAAQAETQRELVCGLTTCPTQQPGSVNS